MALQTAPQTTRQNAFFSAVSYANAWQLDEKLLFLSLINYLRRKLSFALIDLDLIPHRAKRDGQSVWVSIGFPHPSLWNQRHYIRWGTFIFLNQKRQLAEPRAGWTVGRIILNQKKLYNNIVHLSLTAFNLSHATRVRLFLNLGISF